MSVFCISLYLDKFHFTFVFLIEVYKNFSHTLRSIYYISSIFYMFLATNSSVIFVSHKVLLKKLQNSTKIPIWMFSVSNYIEYWQIYFYTCIYGWTMYEFHSHFMVILYMSGLFCVFLIRNLCVTVVSYTQWAKCQISFGNCSWCYTA